MFERNNLTAKANELNNEIQEVMKYFSSKMSLDVLSGMSGDEIEMMVKCMNLMNSSMDYLKAEAEQLDRIEQKLDRLLKK